MIKAFSNSVPEFVNEIFPGKLLSRLLSVCISNFSISPHLIPFALFSLFTLYKFFYCPNLFFFPLHPGNVGIPKNIFGFYQRVRKKIEAKKANEKKPERKEKTKANSMKKNNQILSVKNYKTDSVICCFYGTVQ